MIAFSGKFMVGFHHLFKILNNIDTYLFQLAYFSFFTAVGYFTWRQQRSIRKVGRLLLLLLVSLLCTLFLVTWCSILFVLSGRKQGDSIFLEGGFDD
jgi:hypothetical protein